MYDILCIHLRSFLSDTHSKFGIADINPEIYLNINDNTEQYTRDSSRTKLKQTILVVHLIHKLNISLVAEALHIVQQTFDILHLA